MKKHQKRKGIGCVHERAEEEKVVLCDYAEEFIGSGYLCLAPKKCWMDEKITKKFDDDKHCPNCSKLNKPFDLMKDDKYNAHCDKCKFTLNRTFG